MKFQVQKIDNFTGHRDCVYGLSNYSESKKFISSSGDGFIVEWDITKPDLGKPLAQVNHSVYAVNFEIDSKTLWIGNNYEGINIVDTISKKEIGSIKLGNKAIFDIKTYQNKVFVGDSEGIIHVIDKIEMSTIKHIKASDKSVRTIAINPIEREIAVGYSDNYIRIFDINTYDLKFQFEAHNNSVFSLKYNTNFNVLVSAGRDAKIKSWNVENKYEQEHDINAHLFTINDLAFSKDGSLLASCSMDKSIKIWDSKSFKLLKVIDKGRHAGHGTSINKLLWMDEHTTLLAASDDRSISMWKIEEI
jgi:WD40 repeat protein